MKNLEAPTTIPLMGRDPRRRRQMQDFKRMPDTEAGDWRGVHINSGIPDHPFYRVATQLGGKARGAMPESLGEPEGVEAEDRVPDATTYAVTADDGARVTTVKSSDASMSASFAELLEYLEQLE